MDHGVTGRAAARVELFSTLAELFRVPVPEFTAQWFSGEVRTLMDSWAGALGYRALFPPIEAGGSAASFHDSIRSGYLRLFVGPVAPFALPVESVYKPWDRSPGALLSGQTGFIMGEAAAAMRARYAAARLDIPHEYKDFPDHLALLLEYFAWSVNALSPGEQRKFQRDHLDWIGALQEEARRVRPESPYIELLGYLDTLIGEDARALDGMIAGGHEKEKI